MPHTPCTNFNNGPGGCLYACRWGTNVKLELIVYFPELPISLISTKKYAVPTGYGEQQA